MIRTAALLTIPLLLATSGCNQAIAACEDAIKKDLRSPSSYKQISSSSYRSDQRISVTIEYDAANAFNAPIRATAHCTIPIAVDGSPAYSSARIDFET